MHTKASLDMAITAALRSGREFFLDVKRNTKFRRDQTVRFHAWPHPNPACNGVIVWDITALADRTGWRDFDCCVNKDFPDRFKFIAAILRYQKAEAERTAKLVEGAVR
jgi:hypothetical protein